MTTTPPTLRSILKTQVTAYLRSGPVTLAVIAAAWLIHALGIDAVFGPDSYWEKILISGLSTQTVLGLLPATLGLLTLGISAERALGSVRYLLSAVLSHVLAVTAAVTIGELSDTSPGWAHEIAVGSILTPAVWLFAVSILAAPRYSVVWRRRVQFFSLVIAVVLVLYSGTLQDVAIALAVAGSSFITARQWNWRASLREQRRIAATMVWAVFAGPFLAGLNPHSNAVFSGLGRFVATPAWSVESAQEVCNRARHSHTCLDAVHSVHVAGLAPFLGNVAALFVFTVLCYGLARGRRRAWLATIVTLWLTAGVIVWASQPVGAAWVPFGLAGVVLAAFPGLFQVRGSARALRRSLALLLGLAGTLSVVWLVLFPTRSGLVELPWRFVPPVLSKFSPDPLLPAPGLEAVSYEWTSVIMWTAVGVALLRLFRSTPPTDVPATVRELLLNGSGDHISWMTTWPHNSYWVADEQRGFVAYRVHGTVAVTVGSPVSAPGVEAATVADEFEAFAHGQGWTVAWYSVPEEFAATRAPRFQSLHVAKESVVPVGITFTGKKFQDVRTARNRAGKEGVHHEWLTWEEASPLLHSQIHALSEQWVSEKALPEMGFTLGSVAELNDSEVRLLIAVDEQRHLHGVTSWLPVRHNGEVVGITLDFMRRDREGFRPVIEFLIAEAISTAREIYGEQLEWISLSGAPLAGCDDSRTIGLLLEELGEQLEPLYGFRSLAAFKRKFQPTEHSWLLCYEDSSELPAIGLAVSRCYLPHARLRDAATAASVWREATQNRRG